MTLTIALKDAFKASLLKNNLRCIRTTDLDVLAQFFNRIKPVSTQYPLIRIGGETDGGYLVPDDLEGIETCFSPGVDYTATFENDLAQRGIRCFLADYSVDAPPFDNLLFHFEKKFLGPQDSEITTRLESWVERNAPGQNDFILQMDIEGSEYGVILETSPETLAKFRIMVIEFHRFDVLCEKFGFELINLAFQKLLHHFDIVHIHPNNACKPITYGEYQIPLTMEFTFLRKDRITSRHPNRQFPHPLDQQNVPYLEDFPLPACWYE